MEIIKETIIKKRPSLSQQSIKTYYSILKNLYKNVFGDEKPDVKDFEKSTKIIGYLKNLEPNKRKTVLSALVIMTDDKAYRDLMLEDIEACKTDTYKQEKTEAQKESWVDTSEIQELADKLKSHVSLIYKKKDLDMVDLQKIQNYIIICLLGGIYIPPRRSKDYVDFKIGDIDTSKDNYLLKNKLIYNSYKTSKTYSQQEIDCPKELVSILKKWIKVNPTDYLLFDRNGSKLSNVKLTQRMNKLFDGKKVGVNQLRHTYLSDKYQATIKLNNEMADDLKAMGSSFQQNKVYVKKME